METVVGISRDDQESIEIELIENRIVSRRKSLFECSELLMSWE